MIQKKNFVPINQFEMIVAFQLYIQATVLGIMEFTEYFYSMPGPKTI